MQSSHGAQFKALAWAADVTRVEPEILLGRYMRSQLSRSSEKSHGAGCPAIIRLTDLLSAAMTVDWL